MVVHSYDSIGKGAFGSVYRGLNMVTGEVVAVKQLKLEDIPKSDVDAILVSLASAIDYTIICHAIIPDGDRLVEKAEASKYRQIHWIRTEQRSLVPDLGVCIPVEYLIVAHVPESSRR